LRPRTDPADVLAYFVTFRTFGTWLHGDVRTSVDRRQNLPGSPRIEPSGGRRKEARNVMEGEPVFLSPRQQEICTDAIQSLCTKRSWVLRALNVRSNHVHAVVTASILGERVMADMKAAATRALRVKGEVADDARLWAYHGSTHLLFKPQAVMDACTYVVERQGNRQGIAGDLD
jgi:REP element-mobilizing transposase RayT